MYRCSLLDNIGDYMTNIGDNWMPIIDGVLYLNNNEPASRLKYHYKDIEVRYQHATDAIIIPAKALTSFAPGDTLRAKTSKFGSVAEGDLPIEWRLKAEKVDDQKEKISGSSAGSAKSKDVSKLKLPKIAGAEPRSTPRKEKKEKKEPWR